MYWPIWKYRCDSQVHSPLPKHGIEIKFRIFDLCGAKEFWAIHHSYIQAQIDELFDKLMCHYFQKLVLYFHLHFQELRRRALPKVALWIDSSIIVSAL